jgi:hypothetical protein
LNNDAPRAAADVRKPERRLCPENALGSSPKRAAQAFTINATLCGDSRSGRSLPPLPIGLKTGPSVMQGTGWLSKTASTGNDKVRLELQAGAGRGPFHHAGEAGRSELSLLYAGRT